MLWDYYTIFYHQGVFSILLEREKAFKLAGLEYKPIYILVSQYYENWFKLVENILGVPVSRLAKSVSFF